MVHLTFYLVSLVLVGVALATPRTLVGSDGKTYILETEEKFTWFEAFGECARQKLQLVEIHSQDKNNVIKAMLKKAAGKGLNVWLGSNDEFSRNKKRPFVWSTSGKTMKFSDWVQHEPNNGRGCIEHCVGTYDISGTNYKWNDFRCHVKLGYMCEEHHLHTVFLDRLALKQFNITATTKSAFARSMDDLQQQLDRLKHSSEELDQLSAEIVKHTKEQHKASLATMGQELALHQDGMLQEVNGVVKPLLPLQEDLKSSIEQSHGKFTPEFDQAQKRIDSILTWQEMLAIE